MAASNGSSGGKRNYYNVSYGKISTKQKDIPSGYSEISEVELKSKVKDVVPIDLRMKYVNKGSGEYPYAVFYDSLTGVIVKQEKFENDNGINLNLTINDNDGEESILQVKFYSKYAENLLNRLLNTDTSKQFKFSPYAIAQESDINGKKVKFYTQGVSLLLGSTKVEPLFKHDDKELPPTEQIKAGGKETTSRDKRLDFLYDKFVNHFNASDRIAVVASSEEEDGLPF